MDAILVTLGQNGRPGRSDPVPQAPSPDARAAFAKALAALEGEPAQETADATEAPAGDEAGTEEMTSQEAPTEETLAEDLPTEVVGSGAANIAEIAEEVLPLALGEAASNAPPADAASAVAPDEEVPVVRILTRTTAPLQHSFAQTFVLAQSPQQDAAPSPDVPEVDTALIPATAKEFAAPPEISRSMASAVPVLSRQAGATLPRETTHELSAVIEGEAAVEPDAVALEDEAAEVLAMPKTAAVDRASPQFQTSLAFGTTSSSAISATAIDAKTDDVGLRVLHEAIGPVPMDAGLSQSRATLVATTVPTLEARPVLHAIAEASVKAQDGTIELRLSPEELGRVRISMSHHDHGMSVVLNVERDDTLNLLRRHASELAAALREAGLGEATIEFTHREQSSSHDSQRRAAERAFGTLSDTGTEVERPTLRLSADGALDIRM